MIFFIIILISYAILIFWLVYGLYKSNDFVALIDTPKTTFSIVVPFRNEADNLSRLLASISNLDYPSNLFEVILVDDNSEDNSIEVINAFTEKQNNAEMAILKNTRTSPSPKKDAIRSAIAVAKYDWIITTDADCALPTTWLSIFDTFIQLKQPKLVAGPVTYEVDDSFLQQFQLLDLYSLVGATIGSFGLGKPFMANGANLAYMKKDFIGVNGFEGNDHIASGDDVFLIEKMGEKFPGQLFYLKSREALVHTLPETTWKQLWNQRIRWASKTASYKSIFAKSTGIIVLLMNLCTVVAWGLLFSGQISVVHFIIWMLSKFIIDTPLLANTSKFFQKPIRMLHLMLAYLCYPIFSTLVAVFSLFSGYQWKGRYFKQ
ncbi:glycosyltransferase [Sungkyunkwania multivorans]|uniref:Glycosyltransferase n=1 Tax=Sungkyunkwania multivorans TaxID=1173618 RepID=A0ABW3D2Q4_9FLAO